MFSVILACFSLLASGLNALLGDRNLFQPIPRDNSTHVDTVNFLTCLSAFGFPGNTVIATDDTQLLAVVSNRTETDTDTLDPVTLRCYQLFAYGLFFTHYKYDHFPYDEIRPVTSLEDALVNPDSLPEFIRNKPRRSSDQNKHINLEL
ncbi:hypothetical protein SPOG_04965 [Schizosaccharomyces cryophilus OY26]|uniref:Uncharacterized protein n=1 Tax=Schizosaccharomyces cryophilus (strain OY26 / ATCC MYA-4695 / CBS 11777 / NBRC 106824 / NRRL Y48691) TaxID=653667 RepID=S9X551_SCHCR|nr:uncharacterized protein SPOG_04965 [Schizosaccharomyces cryophilus OY26]EPY52222.1 hypothetical protein SPOG_04965 [Schizosaccharomyces cryophilus OY26]